MKSRPFKQVDVFTATAYFGNPLAVVLDGQDLDDAAMQRFAQWTNLSETTFLLPPTDATADYRVRIFTPGGELPFAGHPTIGSCHAWLQAGGKPKAAGRVVQQCGAGLVPLRHDGGRLAFAAPPLKRSAPSPALLAKVAGALGLKAQQIVAAQMLVNGPAWLGLLLDDADAVLRLTPDHRLLKELGVEAGVAGVPAARDDSLLIGRSNREARAFGHRPAAAPDDGEKIDLEVRAFAAAVGVEEDPVTGSLNAGLAEWLIADGHMPERYVAAQGQCLGRAGRVYIERDSDGTVWVGGDAVTCVDGHVTL
ncbi:PhzF family phenazine biosynthesis protein [Variovorax sp. EBFNA2]|uniref:PhzF family phenazine biosynthesis protein n=1 Tax=Variovorax sp. EBFNA2 TaxID=3342097 RepID=UPI0029C0FF1C|nr:PhzF family phenazine biosynthesis protein [Variovorax boronicumulans]WPG38385.1 PhzF family phenazine biosynthesis protein [Variovorax boronicumulans]